MYITEVRTHKGVQEMWLGNLYIERSAGQSWNLSWHVDSHWRVTVEAQVPYLSLRDLW